MWRSGGVGLALVVHGNVDVVVQTLLESGHHHLQEDQADKLVNWQLDGCRDTAEIVYIV